MKINFEKRTHKLVYPKCSLILLNYRINRIDRDRMIEIDRWIEREREREIIQIIHNYFFCRASSLLANSASSSSPSVIEGADGDCVCNGIF